MTCGGRVGKFTYTSQVSFLMLPSLMRILIGVLNVFYLSAHKWVY